MHSWHIFFPYKKLLFFPVVFFFFFFGIYIWFHSSKNSIQKHISVSGWSCNLAEHLSFNCVNQYTCLIFYLFTKDNLNWIFCHLQPKVSQLQLISPFVSKYTAMMLSHKHPVWLNIQRLFWYKKKALMISFIFIYSGLYFSVFSFSPLCQLCWAIYLPISHLFLFFYFYVFSIYKNFNLFGYKLFIKWNI